MHTSSSSYRQQLNIGDRQYKAVCFHGLDPALLAQLPTVLQLLLENVLRNTQGAERDQAVSAIMSWARHGASTAEIPFLPNRVLMHDTTSTPALVDIAAMRSEEPTSELQSPMRTSYAVF